MSALRGRDVPDRERMWLGARSGLLSGVAFLAAMLVDLAVTGSNANDLRFLAGMVPRGERRWRLVGGAIHFFNSTLLGAAYGRVRPRLAGPGWLAGFFFCQVENAAAWPLMILLNRVNPAVTSGRLPSFNRPVPFLQETFRHAVYGVVLGVIFDRALPGARRTTGE